MKPETLARVFEGVEAAFVLSAGPDIPVMEGNAYAAAKKAGVKRVVKLSARGEPKEIRDTPAFHWHRRSEESLQGLGVEWTILRPGPFASNALKVWGIKQNGGLFLPTAGGKDAPVDPADIAAVAVKALTTSDHAGKAYDLTGPELIGDEEIVAKISAATGIPFKYVGITEEEARRRLAAIGFPPPYMDTIMLHFKAVREHRITIDRTIERVLGRPARNFDAWLAAHRDEFL